MRHLGLIHIVLIVCLLVSGGAMVSFAKKQATAASRERSSNAIKQERQDNSKQIKQTQLQIDANNWKTSTRLNQLNAVSADVDKTTAEVASLQQQINDLLIEIAATNDSIMQINADVDKLRKSTAKSLREARTRRQVMSPLAMIFSANSFTQALKRMGYFKQLEKSRQKKTSDLRENLVLLDAKKTHLEELRATYNESMSSLSKQRSILQTKQDELAGIVNDLKKEGAALRQELAKRQQRANDLDRELDRIIAYEQQVAAEKERQRLEEERKRKAEEERVRAEERKKAEARERERQEAEAAQRQNDEKAKAEARKKANDEALAKAENEKKLKKQAEQEKKKAMAEAKRKEKEEKLRAKEEKQARAKEKKSSKNKKAQTGEEMAANAPKPTVDTKPQQPAIDTTPKAEDFVNRKGQLLFPVSGGYKIVGTFGRNKHADVLGVEVDNSGIDIEAASGTMARAVCGGTVSSIFHIQGYNNIVMVRHGEYLTVYANIGQLSVKKGDKVKSGQSIGKIYSDPDEDNRTVLHFEVRHEREKLNPLEWLKQ